MTRTILDLAKPKTTVFDLSNVLIQELMMI